MVNAVPQQTSVGHAPGVHGRLTGRDRGQLTGDPSRPRQTKPSFLHSTAISHRTRHKHCRNLSPVLYYSVLPPCNQLLSLHKGMTCPAILTCSHAIEAGTSIFAKTEFLIRASLTLTRPELHDVTMGSEPSPFDSIRHIPLYYDSSDSTNSALSLILTLRPEWRESKATIDFVRFTDGITNTVRCTTPKSRSNPT